MKHFIIGSGWKMNNTVKESLALLDSLEWFLGDFKGFPLFVLPPFTALDAVGKRLNRSFIKFGAQNMHWDTSGAYTGEISAPMLVELGCTYVEMNHHERRSCFSENDKTVNRKIHTALQYGLKPILCVGEQEKAEGAEFKRLLEEQYSILLEGIDDQGVSDIIFAYEPRWAIGQKDAAPADYIQSAHKMMREILGDMYDRETGKKSWIAYGGSVNQDNAVEIAVQPDVNGLFIGRAGLEGRGFAKIILDVSDALDIGLGGVR
ncbi:MAG: triose-phosphate isomerase [Firmicutes bacterium HGW-Firmicutes-14]|jgi:triosephosphate isomerase|nr:MAG: triose-phosphate isomerase [Firmicutes bacterium HGW-Firmicutes-14]